MAVRSGIGLQVGGVAGHCRAVHRGAVAGGGRHQPARRAPGAGGRGRCRLPRPRSAGGDRLVVDGLVDLAGGRGLRGVAPASARPSWTSWPPAVRRRAASLTRPARRRRRRLGPVRRPVGGRRARRAPGRAPRGRPCRCRRQVGLERAVVVRAAGGHQIGAAGQVAEPRPLVGRVAAVDGLDAAEARPRPARPTARGQVRAVEPERERVGEHGHPARGGPGGPRRPAVSRALGT